MPIHFILNCIIATFSFLIGAYMHSTGFGLVILLGSGLLIYGAYLHLYTLWPFVWGVTLLGSLSTLLWTSYLDYWLGTDYIAILSSLFVGVFCYVATTRLLKKDLT